MLARELDWVRLRWGGPLAWLLALFWSAPSWAGDSERAVAHREIRNFLQEEFEEDTETRTRAIAQNRLVADRIESVLSGFLDIGGYFRAGYGRSDQGGPMVAFQAPGAASKYRLGNEAENYGELIFGKNFYLPGVFSMDEHLRPDGTPSGPVARVQVRLNFYNPYNAHSSAAETSVGLPEAWASVGNVIPSQPSAKFWAGTRFYRRFDIHIVDFFFWNMSGGGAGIEDVQIGPLKAAFAWIGLGATSGLTYLPQPDPENRAGFSKSNFELRFYEVPLLSGTAEMGMTYATAQSARDADGNHAPATYGFAFNFVHTRGNFGSKDGVNRFSLQYGTGPAKTFTSGFETVQIDGGTFIRTDPSGSFRLRLTESFTTTFNRYFALGPVLMAQLTSYTPGAGRQLWLSAGARPTFLFTRHLNLALEGGIDWVGDEAQGTHGALYKLTFAPQVAIDQFFLSRPVVRAFATLASWTKDFEGQIGGLDFTGRRSGVTWGAQMEAWW